MKNPMIKKEFNHESLNELGYTFSPMEGGYISDDGSTIVNISRSPYKRQVCQYIRNAEKEYNNHINKLREINALEE